MSSTAGCHPFLEQIYVDFVLAGTDRVLGLALQRTKLRILNVVKVLVARVLYALVLPRDGFVAVEDPLVAARATLLLKYSEV